MYSLNISKTIGKCHDVVTINWLFCKLNWFICNQQLVFVVHCLVEPYIGCPYPCPWVLGGHGCDTIGNFMIFEYMGAIWIAWVGMGRHMSWYGWHGSLLMGVVRVWAQIWWKRWTLLPSKMTRNCCSHVLIQSDTTDLTNDWQSSMARIDSWEIYNSS